MSATMDLPDTGATPLIRTDFASDAAWREVAQAVAQPSEDGFRANLAVVEDRAFEGASPRSLAELARRTTGHALLVVADAEAMADPEHALLFIDVRRAGTFIRVIPSELWGLENNLSLGNMDFAEFATACDADGVFRGFPD